MKLKDLVKKLTGKPEQNTDVQFVVWNSDDGTLVCADMSGPMTRDLMRVFAKHAPQPKKPTTENTDRQTVRTALY